MKERKENKVITTAYTVRVLARVYSIGFLFSLRHARPVADPRFRTAMCFSQTTDVNILRPSAETVNDVVGARRCLVTL